MVSIRKISIVLVALVVLATGSITGASANYLAVTDHVSHLVSIYDADTGILHQQINTIALGASLAHPLYSAFGTGDDLLVNDYINGRILNFAKGAGDTWNTTPTVVTALPGNPAGIDVGADGTIYWSSDPANYGYYDGTPPVTTSANALYAPRGVVTTADAVYYCSSAGNMVIRQTLDTHAPVDPNIGGIVTPTGITLGPDYNNDGVSDLYVSSVGAQDIQVLDGVLTPGVANTNLGAAYSVLPGVTDLVWTPDGGNLFIIYGNALVLQNDGTGWTTFADGFTYAHGLALSDEYIPEPGSLLALGTGLIGIFGFAVRRRK